MDYTVKQVAQMIDHTNLHADAVTADFRKLCDEAVQYGFKSVAINTYPVKICREMLKGSEVLTGAAVGFPLGQMTVASKAAEAENAVKDGAQEFDYVLNVGKLKEHDYAYIENDIEEYLKEDVAIKDIDLKVFLKKLINGLMIISKD